MCYNVPLGKVPPRPNWVGFQGSAGENVGAHVLVFHGVAAREWLFITHSHHGPENGLSSLAVTGPVMTTVGKDPLPPTSVLLSLLLVSEVAGRFFTVMRPIRELNQVLGHCVISVVRTSVCPGLPQLMCLLSVITPPLFVP